MYLTLSVIALKTETINRISVQVKKYQTFAKWGLGPESLIQHHRLKH